MLSTPTFGISPEKKLVDKLLKIQSIKHNLTIKNNRNFAESIGLVKNPSLTHRNRRLTSSPMDGGIVPLSKLLDKSLHCPHTTNQKLKKKNTHENDHKTLEKSHTGL